MPMQRLGAPDRPNRRVLFAVELVDPIAQSLVWRHGGVKAAGLSLLPIINRSGRFVWREEGDRWPGTITVTPGNLPFAEHVSRPPPRPAELTKARPEERLLRIALRPTAAYGLADGITAIRGRLCESKDENSPPVPHARVQLAWHDDKTGNWEPPKPKPEALAADDIALPSPPEPETDENGQFVVFLRLNPQKPAQPDIEGGMLAVRLQFTLGRTDPATRSTPADFPFLPADAPSANGPAPAPKGRIPEARVLVRDLKLAWADLTPI